MFNPDIPDRLLAPCAVLVEELDLDVALPGVMFTGELQVEIDEDGDWFIESVTATDSRNRTRSYPPGHLVFHGVCAAVYADRKLCDRIYAECLRHAED